MTSFKLNVSSRRRQYARVLSALRDALARAYAEEHDTRVLTKAQIARDLGRSKGFITRKLTRAENMTILTLSNLAHELGREVDISLPRKDAAIAGSNMWSVSVIPTGSSDESSDKVLLRLPETATTPSGLIREKATVLAE